MAIAAGDFSQRMTDIEPTTTEVGRLKTAINTMLGRVDCRDLAARLDREADAPLHRRREPRAAHPARHGARLRRAVPDGRHLGRRRHRAGDGPHREGGDPDGRPRRGPARPRAPRRAARCRDRTAVDLRPIARDAALDVRAASPLRPVTVYRHDRSSTRRCPPRRPTEQPDSVETRAPASGPPPRPSPAPGRRRCRCCGASRARSPRLRHPASSEALPPSRRSRRRPRRRARLAPIVLRR